MELGSGSRLSMLTTSLGRLSGRGALGAPSCWSMYRSPVILG